MQQQLRFARSGAGSPSPPLEYSVWRGVQARFPPALARATERHDPIGTEACWARHSCLPLLAAGSGGFGGIELDAEESLELAAGG